MNVRISVPGKFHAFKLGRQINERDALGQIYTTYPSFAIGNSGIPQDKVTNICHPELIYQLGNRFPSFVERLPTQWNRPHERWKAKLFDQSVARRLKSVNNGLFVGFAGNSLNSLKVAKSTDYRTAVERASAHIQTQKEILDREYQEDMKYSSPISKAHVRREEKEYETADYIITPSEFAKESFLKRGYDRDNVFSVPYGINPPKINKIEETTDDPFIFLFCGSVGRQKGVPYLLEAWNSLQLDNSKLVFLGGIEPSLEELTQQYTTQDDVQFKGWTDNVFEWYEKASVFVFPSLQEGSAMVTYEAMSAGLPLVTTFNSGWVGESGTHGIEIPPRNSKRLAAAMRELYDNQEKAVQMGETARELIFSKYTEEDYGNRINSIYRKILSD